MVLVEDASGSNEVEEVEDGSAEEDAPMETYPPPEGVGPGVVLAILLGA